MLIATPWIQVRQKTRWGKQQNQQQVKQMIGDSPYEQLIYVGNNAQAPGD